MKEKLKVPKIRFKDFSGEWNYDKLDNILEAKLRPITKPLISYEALGVRCHAKGTFHKEVEDPNSVAIETLYEVKENDLIVNITFAWEHAIAICKKEDEGRLVSHRFPTYVPKDNLSVNFLNYLIKQEFFRYNLELISPGGAGRNRVMNKSKFLEIKLFLPSLAEQQKIANFLSVVDEKIEKLTKKKELLEQYKKGLMQKIFSQEIRFKDDNGKEFPEWEEKEVEEIFNTISTKEYQIKASEIVENGLFPVIDQGQKLVAGYCNDKQKLFFEELPVIIYGDHTTIIKYINYDFVIGADGTKILKNKIDGNLKFLYYSLCYNNIEPEGYKRHFSIIRKVLLNLPSLPEQQKIAYFLSSLDKKIDIALQELGQVQEFKKGLLQQMFV